MGLALRISPLSRNTKTEKKVEIWTRLPTQLSKSTLSGVRLFENCQCFR